MKWYELKEQAAGEKRLMALWFVYKTLGKRAVQFVTIFVAFFAFSFSKVVRNFTLKNLRVIYSFTKDKSARPCLFNAYRLVLNYAFSLVDRMEVFCGKFSAEKLDFKDKNQEKSVIELLNAGNGALFICSHVGNVEVLRAFINDARFVTNPHVNIFLSESQCRIFNGFLKKIRKEARTTAFPVEKISVDTAIELKERLDRGEIAFIAGDRVSAGAPNVTFRADFLGESVDFPLGTFKLAQLMETNVYFITAIKTKNDRYDVYLRPFAPDFENSKSENLKKMCDEYIAFIERSVMAAPLQFYHFYDLFSENE